MLISKKFLNTETIIVTGDRDSFQLVDDTTSVYFTKKGTSDVKIMNTKTLLEEYGVTPTQFIDLKGLQGDTADNIPGVAGVGPKTATDLILKYGSIESIYEHIDEISGKLKEKLNVANGLTKDELEKLVMDRDNTKQLIGEKTVVKVISVPGKLVNIVVK